MQAMRANLAFPQPNRGHAAGGIDSITTQTLRLRGVLKTMAFVFGFARTWRMKRIEIIAT